MKKAFKYLGITVAALAVLLAVAVLFAPRLGWQVDTVLSGSMSPTLGVGSAAVVRPVEPQAVEIGDVITYRSPRNGDLTTHRVIGIAENSPLYFRTKGDANENPDVYLVPSANLEGKVVFDVPLVGYATDFVKTPLGFILILGIPGMGIIAMEVRRMWTELAEEEKRKKAEAAIPVGIRGVGGEE